MNSKWLRFVVAIGISLVTLVACDLQKAALKIFTNQGLTVLQPARDYIALGGIVVLPKKGRPQYIDPYDTLSGSDGTYSNFSAVIQQQTQNQSTGIEAAVGTLASFIPVPAGLNFTTGQQVQLAQIDSGGTRLTTQDVLALLRKSATGTAIIAQLQAQPGNRVFVVQEVYTAKSMDLKSSSNLALDASYAGGGSLPTCNASPAAASDTNNSNSNQPSGTGNNVVAAASNTGAKAGTAANANPSTGSSPTTSGSASSAHAAPAGSTSSAGAATGAASPNTNAASGSGGGVGISVGVCRASQFEISFQSQTAIPFAVRLNEVQLKPGGLLDLKYTNFTIPGTLGGGKVDATATIDQAFPMLEEMEHVQH